MQSLWLMPPNVLVCVQLDEFDRQKAFSQRSQDNIIMWPVGRSLSLTSEVPVATDRCRRWQWRGLSAGLHMKQIKAVKAITGQLGTHGIMEDVRDQHKCLRPSSKTLNKWNINIRGNQWLFLHLTKTSDVHYFSNGRGTTCLLLLETDRVSSVLYCCSG